MVWRIGEEVVWLNGHPHPLAAALKPPSMVRSMQVLNAGDTAPSVPKQEQSAKFAWTDRMHKAFEKLAQTLTESSVFGGTLSLTQSINQSRHCSVTFTG